MTICWLNHSAPVLEALIRADLVAFRERFKQEAIGTLDDEGGRINPRGFYTNIGYKGSLFTSSKAAPTLKLVVDLYQEAIPKHWIRQDQIRALDPSEFWEEGSEQLKHTMTFVEALGLQVVKSAEIPRLKNNNPVENREAIALIIVSCQHSQRLIDIWRQYIENTVCVMTLLGLSAAHVLEDLHLPVTRYVSLINRDVLQVISPEVREKMIPESV